MTKTARIWWVSVVALLSVEYMWPPYKLAHASFGAEIPVLLKLVVEAVNQVRALQTMVSTSRETLGLLNEMNRGVKDVLRLARTAHVPIPPQVYESARTIEQATTEANRLFGRVGGNAPAHTQTQYQSGTEGLYLSRDAFEYSTFLDESGERIKSSAIVSNQATATRLTAESMGVLLHAVSHSNRIQAKSLELNATARLEHAAKENARFESFVTTHSNLERNFRATQFAPLNSFGDAAASTGGSSSDEDLP